MGRFPFFALNPEFVPYHDRIKTQLYKSVPRILVVFYEVEDTRVQEDARIFMSDDLVLYMGPDVEGYKGRSKKITKLLKHNHIYRVFSDGDKSYRKISLLLSGEEPGCRRLPVTKSVRLEQVRHVKKSVELVRKTNLEQEKLSHCLKALVRERLEIDARRDTDNVKIYILHRLATENGILEILGIEERDPIAILNNKELRKEVFALLWKNDPLRLVQEQELMTKA